MPTSILTNRSKSVSQAHRFAVARVLERSEDGDSFSPLRTYETSEELETAYGIGHRNSRDTDIEFAAIEKLGSDPHADWDHQPCVELRGLIARVHQREYTEPTTKTK